MKTVQALFPSLLGEAAWHGLPASVRAMHGSAPRILARGKADVGGSHNVFARALRRLLGLPSPGAQQILEVCIERHGASETWTRRFARGHMRSTLHPDIRSIHLLERLGPVTLRFALHPYEHGVEWHLNRAWVLGVRVPRTWLGEVLSRSSESDGRYAFAVDTHLPWIGQFISYRGWLEIVADD
jgi:hypothetical protein